MGYINALAEIAAALAENKKALTNIDYLHIYIKEVEVTAVEELEKLSKIDYDSGYGQQNLYGAIVFKDKSWLERGEYDGAEWWEYKTVPTKESIENHIKEVRKWK